MIDPATLYEMRLLLGGVVATVLGLLLIGNGLRQIETGGTRVDKREWLESRLFMTINVARWLLGKSEKQRVTRAEVRLLGWTDFVLGILGFIIGIWCWLEVFR